MRRRAGVGAIQDKKAAQDRFRDKGTAIQENLVEEVIKALIIQVSKYTCTNINDVVVVKSKRQKFIAQVTVQVIKMSMRVHGFL